MFFEGCPAHLGCSIKLRGASEYELARVKEIIMLMVCVAYHSQLEISFLMDEFAMPPSLAQSTYFPCLLDGGSTEDELDRGDQQKMAVQEAQEEQWEAPPSEVKPTETDAPQDGLNPASLSLDETGNTETLTSTPFSSPPAPPLAVPPPFLLEDDQETLTDTLVRAAEEESQPEDEERSETSTPRLFRDPLQDDTGMFVAEQVTSSDDRLQSISAVFKQELKDIILCISPFITFKEPFLLTPPGMHCPSRDYFPEQVLDHKGTVRYFVRPIAITHIVIAVGLLPLIVVTSCFERFL